MFMITNCRQIRENGETNKFSMKNRWKSQCKWKNINFKKKPRKKTKFQQKNRWLFQRVCIDSRKIFPYFFDIFWQWKSLLFADFFHIRKLATVRSRTNGVFGRNLLANFSRTNGHSNKWGFCPWSCWAFAKMGRFWLKKTCQTTGISRAKRTFSRNGKFENVANYSRTNRNSNKWDFGAEKLAQKTKMGSHLFASVLYITYDTWRLSCAITYDWHTFTYQTVLSLTHARNGDELLIILACHRRIFGTSGCSQTVFY